MSVGDRILDVDSTFFLGAKSDMEPGQLPLGYVWTAINLINLGGHLSTRPGHRCVVALPDGNLQGAALFRPRAGIEQAVVCIDGILYASPWPFTDFRMLEGVRLSSQAKQVFWCQTTQSAARLSEDFTAGIKVIVPRAVLLVQDGGLTAPVWFDGTTAGHVRDYAFDTIAGGPMCWVGDRLWVATGNQLFASDISNPFSFREQIYLGGVSSFFFAGDITALIKTTSVEAPQLMVFTRENGSLIQANVRDRNAWPTTVDFQKEVVQVGCTSSRSAIAHYGSLAWYSPAGFVLYDPATASKLTARLPIRDNELLVSKTALSDDLSKVAAGSFGQFLLLSVPAEDTYNKHTWVLNHASLETLSDNSGPSWCGHWLGTRPVEWFGGQIADAERVYHVSVDADGKNRLWESFQPERLDNGCPIMWAIETRGYHGTTATQAQKLPGSRCRLTWADIFLAGISEDLDLGVFFAGGTRGSYKPMMRKRVRVEKGSLSFEQELDKDSQVFAFKPQSRKLRTEDANQQSVEGNACGVERPDLDNIDESFQLLIVGHGPATVRMIRAFGQTVSEDFAGEPEACEDEADFNAVRFDGVGVRGESFAEVVQALSISESAEFTSNQTAVVEQDGLSAVGVGSSESIVSQAAADRVASIIATKQAEAELQRDLPKILSVGKED